jgi:hypothetical protein
MDNTKVNWLGQYKDGQYKGEGLLVVNWLLDKNRYDNNIKMDNTKVKDWLLAKNRESLQS